MKKIFYLLVVAVLLAACSSRNEVRTYSNGKMCTILPYIDNGMILFDTISNVISPYDLFVLVDKDTIWFNSSAFSFNIDEVVKNEVHFQYKFLLKEDIVLPVKATSTNDYYAVMNFGKFFNINDIYKIYYWRATVSDKKTNSKSEIYQVKDLKYELDIDQFKHLKK